MQGSNKIWVRFALINLCIVVALGALMRYKIGFVLPFLNQKYLQEAHSHFAFTGWITHSLFFLLVCLFRNNLDRIREKTYRILIYINLVCAYGMVFSFAVQGYGPVSLTFSTASVLTGYVFAYFALKDAGRLSSGHLSRNWIRAAIWFGILSTGGTILLSHMMATRQYDQTTYLGSIYFYLHFQYNGWFLFACFALFIDKIKSALVHALSFARHAFWLFFLSGIPAFFLSILWIDLPEWLYVFVVLAAILQVIGWWYFIRLIRLNQGHLNSIFPASGIRLFQIIALALTLKLFLQLFSTVPEISDLAFGFRPIVIAYLHLVLLLIISLFLLTFMFSIRLLDQGPLTRISLMVFTAGIVLTETLLAVQGIAGFSYTIIPFANESLFVFALVMLLCMLLILKRNWNNQD